MRVCVLLLCVCSLSWATAAQRRWYLVTAPLSLRVDAEEAVLVQLFGFSEAVSVHVSLKTSMAPDHRVLAREVVTLNPQNRHQALATFRLPPAQLDPGLTHVTLHVQSAEVNQHLSVPLSRNNGFLFVQTDKPLYTPLQHVQVRVFSINQELKPANRSVRLTFKDPDHTTVDTVEILDLNNGIPSMQNPFKIPANPKLGVWSIEASYSDDFTTTGRSDFEIREYVLPSFTISVDPEVNFISYGNFNRFRFKVSARYRNGAPVAEGEVFLRYGFVSGKTPPTIVPSSVGRERLSPAGKVDMVVDLETLLSRDLDSLMGTFLYITVLLQEDTGGLSQEAEFASVKFVRSPFSLRLVSTPPFIKPGLPYIIQVLVKDHLDKPVNRVPVRLVERRLFRGDREAEPLSCPDSQSDGLAIFVCSMPAEAERAELKFVTAAPGLPAVSQATLSLRASAYRSPNRRYLYIDPPLPGRGLKVGQRANVKVFSATPAYLPVGTLSYLVLSKGKVVELGSSESGGASSWTLNFLVTGAMVPSVRLLVYYILDSEGTAELVADSVWLDVRDACVAGLKTELSSSRRSYKPKETLHLEVRTNEDGLLALSAVDSALFALRPDFRDPVTTVLRHLEEADLGCGGGGGRDAAHVFRLAGLTFVTNAGARASDHGEACAAAVRPRRALTDAAKKEKVDSFPDAALRRCCRRGMRFVPKSLTCAQFSAQVHGPDQNQNQNQNQSTCAETFTHCCIFIQTRLDQHLNLGRHALGADFDLSPSQVRSFFPESWLWEVQSVRAGQLSVSRPLPDSLTTWDVRAVGLSRSGVCVSPPLQVSVHQSLSVDVALPYQVVRGEQVELPGSVHNQGGDAVTFCVELTVGPSVCLLGSVEVGGGGGGLRRSPCSWAHLAPGGVAKVTFTLMGLERGEHTLTFDLRVKGQQIHRDVLEKKLRVVPEGVRTEVFSGGRLDPQGLFGSVKTTVTLKNTLPPNMVPNSPVQRELTITGEVLGDFLSVVLDPAGLRRLVNLPSGSAEAELGGLLPLVHVFQYLERTGTWTHLGPDVRKNSAHLSRKIRDGVVALSSFRHADGSYSMWRKQKPSTWLTALAVRTLALVAPVVPVAPESLSQSVRWLVGSAQQEDGSFVDSSSFRPNKFMAGGSAASRSVYLTSFVLMALCRATRGRDPQPRFYLDRMRSAADFLSRGAAAVGSVHVRAAATYALALHDPESRAANQMLSSMERLARHKGNPVELRYWPESSGPVEWSGPVESGSASVQSSAYMLLTALLKGRIHYANPILTWLMQDQHYGGGFYSVQDTALTLEAVSEYCRTVPRAVLDQDIRVRYNRKGELTRVRLGRTKTRATPITVTEDDDIIVSTGFGRGVSTVKLRTVYYETHSSTHTCHFDLSVNMMGQDVSTDPSLSSPHLVACVQYRPPPNDLNTESSLTVMEIQLPTGVDCYLEDLRQFRDTDEPLISHFELQGNTVVIQADTVPSRRPLCVGFRVRSSFRVGGAAQGLVRVYEPQDQGSLCTKAFTSQQQQLQRLCVAEECQCMTAACATYRGNMDNTRTLAQRTRDTCAAQHTYAFRVKVTSSASDGDFVTYTTSVEEVLKNTHKDLAAVSKGTQVQLVKKTTCVQVQVEVGAQYLLLGARGSEVTLSHGFRYRLPLDSDSVLELWPGSCSDPGCLDFVRQMEEAALELQLFGCGSS